MINTREKSSQSDRIYFGALRDEKNRQVCLIMPEAN
jgi:hypothetical protein